MREDQAYNKHKACLQKSSQESYPNSSFLILRYTREKRGSLFFLVPSESHRSNKHEQVHRALIWRNFAGKEGASSNHVDTASEKSDFTLRDDW